MIAQTEKIRELVGKASGQYILAKRIPEQDVPAVIDNSISDGDNEAVLRGSIIRVTKNGSKLLYAVPAVGEVFKTTSGTAKIMLIAKWGEAAKSHTLNSLGTVEGVLMGILTMPTAAGAFAGGILLGDMVATISPGPTGDAIDTVNVSAAGASINKDVTEVMAETGMSWRPWLGEPGGFAGIPKGDGLPTLAELDAASQQFGGSQG